MPNPKGKNNIPKFKETLDEKQARIKEAAIMHATTFYHYKLIAMATGIDDNTLKKYRETDKDFSDRLEEMRANFIGKKMKAARPEFLLERLNPELFKERKESDIKVTLPKPILDVDVPTDDGNKKD